MGAGKAHSPQLVVLWEDGEGRKEVVRVRGFHVAESKAPRRRERWHAEVVLGITVVILVPFP